MVPGARRCPRAGPDDDCVLAPPLPRTWQVREGHAHPFLRYRPMLWAHRRALRTGLGDDAYVSMVKRLDDAVAEVDRRRVTATPTTSQPALAETIGVGELWVKDDTVMASGTHKIRHLFGSALHLEIDAATGADDPSRPLAIASCGNAAVAAAVMAAAMGRRLRVHVPPVAPAALLDRIDALGAEIVMCERAPGDRGDPTYARFSEAVGGGAAPFGCQGPDNGLTIDGGRTLGYELAEQIAASAVANAAAAGANAGAAVDAVGARLDHVAVQVGGGALATSLLDGLAVAAAAGVLARRPCAHPVQAEGAHPLILAVDRVLRRFGGDPVASVAAASAHRSAIMAPWPSEPASVASAIIDDETYDWQAVTAHVLATGGCCVVVDDDAFERARRAVRSETGVPADHTGAAGVAGISALVARGVIASDAACAVVVTGTGPPPRTS